MKAPVSLQINLAPGDYPYARFMLPHQLKTLASQVNEIVLTVDTRKSKGRFADKWDENETLLYDYLHDEIQSKYAVKIIPVDYTLHTKTEVARYFFGGENIPDKDFRGGPFYAYFFGLHSAANDLVFHLDADMFLGGGSDTWVNEAVEMFKLNKNCLIVSPLPGPPHKDDILIDQSVQHKIAPYTYQLKGMSSRIYLTDRSLFGKHKLVLQKPGASNQVKAIVEGNPNADLPEHLITNYMEQYGLKRIDFLGVGKGLWSLHPPYRSQLFYDKLETVLTNIETNNLPESQQGFYDIIDEVCDWTAEKEKLKTNRWWKRLLS